MTLALQTCVGLLPVCGTEDSGPLSPVLSISRYNVYGYATASPSYYSEQARNPVDTVTL